MPDETQDVSAESSPVTDVNTESSPVAPVETPTSKVEQEQVVPYDRFKEVADEKNYWREQAMAAQQRPQQPVSIQHEESDPYAGMDAQTRVFYQEIDKRAEKIAQRLVNQKESEYRTTIEALAFQNAKIQEKLFRSEAKDVVPGSAEEREIANLIRAGLDPEKAAWAVMGPKREAAAKSAAQAKQQQKVQQKAQAGMDTSSIPTHSAVSGKEKLSFRESMERKMQAAGF